MYGLTDIEHQALLRLFADEEHLQRVILYGSRAKGTYRPFSDIDITLDGEFLTEADVSRIAMKIDDLLLPYQFDISRLATLHNPALLDHINRRGIVMYQAD